jgi:2-amino-4-hydroxy-6-hydroxymethyldihydropteridine diphosphokinase
MIHTVWLLLGGNEGNVAATLNNALILLEKRVGRIISRSEIYCSAAWNMEVESMPAENRIFSNMAVEVETSLQPLELLDACKETEKKLGRNPVVNMDYDVYKSRPIDIDIIFYDDIIYNNPRLFIPHPLAHIREFVLNPLNEICPDKVHPLYGKTIKTLRMYESGDLSEYRNSKR